MDLNYLSPSEFEEATRYNSLIFDARKPEKFVNGFIPGSVYLYGDFFGIKYFKKYATANKEDLYLVASEKRLEEKSEFIQQAAKQQVIGFLEGGFTAWETEGKPIDIIISIEPDEIMMDMKYGNPRIADVRNKTAFELMHVEGAEHVAYEDLLKNASKLKEDEIYYLYCEDGEFSLSLISILKREGFHNFYHLQGGFKSLNAAEATMVKS